MVFRVSVLYVSVGFSRFSESVFLLAVSLDKSMTVHNGRNCPRHIQARAMPSSYIRAEADKDANTRTHKGLTRVQQPTDADMHQL